MVCSVYDTLCKPLGLSHVCRIVSFSTFSASYFVHFVKPLQPSTSNFTTLAFRHTYTRAHSYLTVELLKAGEVRSSIVS